MTFAKGEKVTIRGKGFRSDGVVHTIHALSRDFPDMSAAELVLAVGGVVEVAMIGYPVLSEDRGAVQFAALHTDEGCWLDLRGQQLTITRLEDSAAA